MISVIIPIYNADKYLVRLFQCLDNQIFSDYEILLINDGSTDRSFQICSDYAKTRNSIHVYTQENQGVSAARNLGLKKVKGDYITFVDSDDMIPENYLNELFLGASQSNADIIVCDIVIINHGKEVNRFTDNPGNLYRTESINKLLTRKYINSGPCGKLYKKTILKNSLFENLKTYEDILFNISVFSNANNIHVINSTEYLYMQNEGSAMNQENKSVSNDIIIATDKIMDYINMHPELDPKCTYITLSHLFQYCQIAVKQNNTAFIKSAATLFRKYRSTIRKCSAFPWKEKIVFILYGYGFLYNNNHLLSVRKELQ